MPRQLLVRARKGRNNITALPHDTSLFDVKATLPDEEEQAKAEREKHPVGVEPWAFL